MAIIMCVLVLGLVLLVGYLTQEFLILMHDSDCILCLYKSWVLLLLFPTLKILAKDNRVDYPMTGVVVFSLLYLGIKSPCVGNIFYEICYHDVFFTYAQILYGLLW